ncbi:peptide chain release factor 1 [Planomonospora sphaerica]|uniref:Peptide chain release factor 1 n=1 Tax=Planomonospora sphaerica TaxID=161355 RepID=A0A161LYJ5_9ACTN|nr:Vms1/Ankzf1 family peptidyl-tRNA hydrolase [Planomonospora sphaerica]GAT70919.1 peptide chain release factor 1 [Planomonospora sphaerica]
MKLDMLRSVYDREGPFASAYLDTDRAVEQGGDQVRLRWEALSEQLAGADKATLSALEKLFTDVSAAAPGRAAFAAGGEILHTEALAEPPRRATARWSALPHVMPLLAQRGENVPHVRVVIDHLGADVITVGSGAPRRTAVQVQDWPHQKTAQGGWSQRHYENNVEETWARNARAVAEAVDEEVRRVGAELVIVAGDPQSRPLLQDSLGKEASAVLVTVDHGSRATGSDPLPFNQDVESAIDSWLDRRREELLERHREGSAKELAVSGLAATACALREGRVDTLLLVDRPDADGLLWVGPDGTQLAVERDEMQEWGVAEPWQDRADAALARAVCATDAALWFVPELDAPDGVGAVLRF